MATKLDIQNWIIDSLKRNNGSAQLVQVAKDIWLFYERLIYGVQEIYFIHGNMICVGPLMLYVGMVFQNLLMYLL